MDSPKHETFHAFLIAVDPQKKISKWQAEESIEELSELCKTAGLVVVGHYIQKREHPDTRTYVGKGVVDDILEKIPDQKIEVVIADDELTPAQQRNLEETLKVKVMDRTSTVLSIFADHARTHEAMLQVELAQLDYLLPRLTRMWTHLSRLAGGIGTKGPGETQLEVDRRRINTRMQALKKDLKKVIQHRHTVRQKRGTVPLVTAALVGYTNSGKSTLMNRITKAEVLAEDQLFATLDTTTRKLQLPNNDTVLISDTVGFIQKLPHQLVDAFKSTLEELQFTDILIHVVDASHPRCFDMMETTIATLNELGVHDKPQLVIMNKRDKLDPDLTKQIRTALDKFDYGILFSAKEDQNIDPILDLLSEMMESFRTTMTFRVPYTRMDIVNLLHKHGDVQSEVYDELVTLEVRINRVIGDKLMGDLN